MFSQRSMYFSTVNILNLNYKRLSTTSLLLFITTYIYISFAQSCFKEYKVDYMLYIYFLLQSVTSKRFWTFRFCVKQSELKSFLTNMKVGLVIYFIFCDCESLATNCKCLN